MQFKTSHRFIAIQSLKAVLVYLLGFFIALKFFEIKDPLEFFIITFTVCFIVFLFLLFPRKIRITDGALLFGDRNQLRKTRIKLADISKVESKNSSFCNGVEVTTTANKKYLLYPQNSEELIAAMSSK